MSYRGDAGAVETFRLSAGDYAINQMAQYDPTNDPEGSGECFFSGYFENLTTGNGVALGSTSPFVDGVPLGTAVSGFLSGGTYQLTIYPSTTCDWSIQIVPNTGG